MEVVAFIFDMRYFILKKHRAVPCKNLAEWAEWFMAVNREDQSRVAKTVLLDGDILVSTVFVGVNYSLGRLPLLFETMVFGGELDEYMRRYSCWQDAEEGHEETVEKVKESTACINGNQS